MTKRNKKSEITNEPEPEGFKFRIKPTYQQKHQFSMTFGACRFLWNQRVEEANKRDARARRWHEDRKHAQANAFRSSHHARSHGKRRSVALSRASRRRDTGYWGKRKHEDEIYPYEWKTIPQYKEQYPFLRKVDSLALKNVNSSFFDARAKCFEGKRGRPRFKSRFASRQSYSTDNQKMKSGDFTAYLWQDTKHKKRKVYLHIPKLQGLGDIPTTLKEIPDDITKITTVTISMDASGRYYASLKVRRSSRKTDCDRVAAATLEGLSMSGQDLGLKTYSTDSSGVGYGDPHDDSESTEKLLARLKIEERKLGKQQARLKKQGKRLSECSNYQKQRRRVAKLKVKIANRRRDFRHKLSCYLARRDDIIAIEDLNVKGMMCNRHLARAIGESAWSDFVRMLEYKVAREGGTLVKVGRYYASTRTCLACGAKSGPSGLSGLDVRAWECPECGAHRERDVNAAVNILLEGLRLLCVDDPVRFEPVYLECCNRLDSGVSLVRMLSDGSVIEGVSTLACTSDPSSASRHGCGEDELAVPRKGDKRTREEHCDSSLGVATRLTEIPSSTPKA